MPLLQAHDQRDIDGGGVMLPEDPECPYPLKLMAIAALEQQIERIKESIDWERVKNEESR